MSLIEPNREEDPSWADKMFNDPIETTKYEYGHEWTFFLYFTGYAELIISLEILKKKKIKNTNNTFILTYYGEWKTNLSLKLNQNNILADYSSFETIQ